MAVRCQIRPGTPADTPRLAALERQCFTDPWSARGLREMLESAPVFTLVAEDGGDIVGYAMARSAAETGEILNLAVDPERRREGIAAALIDAILEGLVARQVGEVYLEVRESNHAARALYQGRGFGVAGMRRAYYRNPTEDALVLRLLPGAPRK